ncbi:MAG: 50S ribosomal protein L15 [FCB group bacterium]|jgi:large subunit ribosomal protein L15|nr:50S ribosomal protein L15 [FCB group bacterium]
MDLSTLQPGPRKKRKRVGRGPGSGTGKTAGRGHKGAKSRSGYSRKVGFEGGQMPLNRRLPKRGFHHDDRFPYAIVNVDDLAKQFEDGADVNPDTLKAGGVIRSTKGGVKVLGRGDLGKRLVVKAQAISDTARQKIEAAGGSVEILPAAPQKG